MSQHGMQGCVHAVDSDRLSNCCSSSCCCCSLSTTVTAFSTICCFDVPVKRAGIVAQRQPLLVLKSPQEAAVRCCCWDPLGITRLQFLQDCSSCMGRAEGAAAGGLCCVLLLLLLLLQHAAEVVLLWLSELHDCWDAVNTGHQSAADSR